MQREMAKKGIRRDEVNPAYAVLFGAAAGYAVRRVLFLHLIKEAEYVDAAVGRNIPYRYDQVTDADRRVLACVRPEIQVNSGLRTHRLADGGHWCLYAWAWSHSYPVSKGDRLRVAVSLTVIYCRLQIAIRQRRNLPGI